MLRQLSSLCNSLLDKGRVLSLSCPSYSLPTAGLKAAYKPLGITVQQDSSRVVCEDWSGGSRAVSRQIQMAADGLNFPTFFEAKKKKKKNVEAEPDPETA